MKYTDTQILDFIEANYATRGGNGKPLREEVAEQMDSAGMAPTSKLPPHGGNYDPTMFETVPTSGKCLQCGTSSNHHQSWCSFSAETCPQCKGHGYLGPNEDGDEEPCGECKTTGRIHSANAEVSHGDRERQPDTHQTHKQP